MKSTFENKTNKILGPFGVFYCTNLNFASVFKLFPNFCSFLKFFCQAVLAAVTTCRFLSMRMQFKFQKNKIILYFEMKVALLAKCVKTVQEILMKYF